MSEMTIEPYLFFEGRCEEAITLYREALGAEVEMMMRFEQSPEPQGEGEGECMLPEGSEKKIMHASITIGGARILMSDGMCSGGASFGGVSVSLSVPEAETVDRFFGALAEGGSVQMPPGETFWSKRFSMVTDRFGVSWMVGVPGEPPPGA